jgi:hypothetical protein
MSVAEQRNLAVLAVIAEGHEVASVADPDRQRQGVHRPVRPSADRGALDRICRENGVEHLLTAPRSPTTTGKIERFHRSMRAECLTGQLYGSVRLAQAAVDEWVEFYNTQRPHQSLDMEVPAARFARGQQSPPRPLTVVDRSGDDWVSRRVGANGEVCVSWQQVSVGKHHAGARCDVQVTDQLLQCWIGNELCKTVARTSRGEVRKKRASVPTTTV